MKADRQCKVQKRGERQSQKTGAPLNEDSARQCQAATKGEEEGEKRLVNSQVKILEPLHILDKYRDVLCIK